MLHQCGLVQQHGHVFRETSTYIAIKSLNNIVTIAKKRMHRARLSSWMNETGGAHGQEAKGMGMAGRRRLISAAKPLQVLAAGAKVALPPRSHDRP
jgi:hypothetical protein